MIFPEICFIRKKTRLFKWCFILTLSLAFHVSCTKIITRPCNLDLKLIGYRNISFDWSLSNATSRYDIFHRIFSVGVVVLFRVIYKFNDIKTCRVWIRYTSKVRLFTIVRLLALLFLHYIGVPILYQLLSVHNTILVPYFLETNWPISRFHMSRQF